MLETDNTQDNAGHDAKGPSETEMPDYIYEAAIELAKKIEIRQQIHSITMETIAEFLAVSGVVRKYPFLGLLFRNGPTNQVLNELTTMATLSSDEKYDLPQNLNDFFHKELCPSSNENS